MSKSHLNPSVWEAETSLKRMWALVGKSLNAVLIMAGNLNSSFARHQLRALQLVLLTAFLQAKWLWVERLNEQLAQCLPA